MQKKCAETLFLKLKQLFVCRFRFGYPVNGRRNLQGGSNLISNLEPALGIAPRFKQQAMQDQDFTNLKEDEEFKSLLKYIIPGFIRKINLRQP